MYKIVRKFYNSTRDLENENFCKVHAHQFTPLTLEEALTIKRKLCTPKFAIEVIEMIDAEEM